MKNIAKIKSLLLAEKEVISRRALEEEVDLAGDEVDAIQGKIIANIRAQILARDAIKLRAIESAMTKINEGSFGVCEDCGEDIPEKRILINPMFSCCVVCAEKQEEAKR